MKESENKYKAVELSDENLAQVSGGGYNHNDTVTVTDGKCGHDANIVEGKCSTRHNGCAGCKYA